LGLGLRAEGVDGRLLGGGHPLAGARVFPDRPLRVGPASSTPFSVTGEDGRFHLEVAEGDAALVVEKEGWQRDFIPRSEWTRPIQLKPAPQFRREPVAVVRLVPPGAPGGLTDEDLRRFLFSREPGVASAANYLYEVSKGSLLLEEGALLRVDVPASAAAGEAERERLARLGLEALKGRDLRRLDRVDNRDGSRRPDGRADHVWVLVPGPPGSVTADPAHLKPACLLLKPSWDRRRAWPVVILPEEAPLGNVVHEAFHAMGEHRVDDLYRDCADPETAGIWDLMDAGQYRGWDAYHPRPGPWREDTGYSPSHPGPWVRGGLWYRGRFAATLRTLQWSGKSWTGWLDPAIRAPASAPQRLIVPDPSGDGRFWELWVARPWGFEAGRVGGRTGPGHQGLLVARVDPFYARRRSPGVPVRILDAHPDSPEPPQPRLPCGRWQLDDAAFNLGAGETARGSDGPFTWEILQTDGAGRLRIRIQLRPRGNRP
jgi:hypothetical protein